MSKLWTFKYAPEKIEDMIVSDELKPKLEKAIKELPNIMLYGTAGVGKGTFANILLKTTGYDHMWINASDETGIDVIREKIQPFATSMPMSPMQIVVLNESDSLTSSSKQNSQKMLKQLMEDVHKVTRFVFLTNNINEMIPELQSRCGEVLHVCSPPIKEIGKFALNILRKENIKFEGSTVMEIVKKCYPDIRKTILALQGNCIDGKLTGSLISLTEGVNKKLFRYAFDKDIENLRKELRANYVDYPDLFSYFYENVGDLKKPGEAIILIGEHMFRHVRYPVPEINFMSMIMSMIYKQIL